jgi:hypothetical protein
MKKNNRIQLLKNSFILIVPFLINNSFLAQESVNTAGGNTSSTSGSVSYSIGQPFYINYFGTSGNVAQGVQQPYEISIALGLKDTSIDLEMSIYPNPTANLLKLTSQNKNIEGLGYVLYDIKGKVIKNNKITSSNTVISMATLPKAIYFLKVTDNQKKLKTFKIIKN